MNSGRTWYKALSFASGKESQDTRALGPSGNGQWDVKEKRIIPGLSLNEDSVREPRHYFASLRRDNDDNMNIVENISKPHLFTLLSGSWHLVHVRSGLIGTKVMWTISHHSAKMSLIIMIYPRRLRNHLLNHPLTLLGYLIHIILPN